MKTVVLMVLMGLCTQLQARTELVFGKEQGVRAAFCKLQVDAEAMAYMIADVDVIGLVET